jgi:hypothetical protein
MGPHLDIQFHVHLPLSLRSLLMRISRRNEMAPAGARKHANSVTASPSSLKTIISYSGEYAPDLGLPHVCVRCLMYVQRREPSVEPPRWDRG